jgi:nucleotide-binding universal stress UspA family protein
MAYRHILIPLDGSKLSEQALGQLVQIAAPGAAIQLISVKAEDITSEVNMLSRSVTAGQNVATGWPPIAGVKDPHAPDAREQYLH